MAEVLTHNQTFKSPQEALLHYGVKGMKWGVRKDDPRGGASSSSRTERKQEKRDTKVGELTARAAKADIRSAELRKEIASQPKGFAGTIRKNQLRNELAQNEAYSRNLTKTAERVQEGKLTPTQRNLLIGGAVLGGLVAVGYASSKMESGEAQAFIAKGKARLQGKPFEFTKNDNLKNASTPDEVSAWVTKNVNPGYNTPGGQMNCRRCTFAYELRRRGFDVNATTSALGYGQSETGLLNALTPGQRNINRATSLSSQVVSGLGIRGKATGDRRSSVGTRKTVADAKDRQSFIDALRDQPSGARGEAVFNFGAFGHSLAYEKFGDKVWIFDTQKNQKYDVSNADSYNSFLQKWGYHRVSNVELTRLDNVDLDYNFLSRWSANRSTPTTRSAPSTPKPKREPSTLPSERPANMHITTWNALQREAGLR